MTYSDEQIFASPEQQSAQEITEQRELQMLFRDLAKSQIPEEVESIQLRITTLLAKRKALL